ncbi:MAG: hypothetical protein Pg6A_18880 [Termitinemataceae bacterium]|nr:MAG: hypothetical protein Pg6A_18880 [Termitinemataceae bacterium]
MPARLAGDVPLSAAAPSPSASRCTRHAYGVARWMSPCETAIAVSQAAGDAAFGGRGLRPRRAPRLRAARATPTAWRVGCRPAKPHCGFAGCRWRRLRRPRYARLFRQWRPCTQAGERRGLRPAPARKKNRRPFGLLFALTF